MTIKRFFILKHCQGNRRILCGEKHKEKIEFDSICSASMGKIFELVCCQKKKVVLIDRTPNLCPFVFCQTFYATYCKINDQRKIAKSLDKTRTKPSYFEKDDCILYVTPLNGCYVIDTVFTIEKVLSLEESINEAPNEVKKYHYDKIALKSHGWEHKDFSKKKTLIANPNKSFIPVILPEKVVKINTRLKMTFKNHQEIDFAQIDSKLGNEIYKELESNCIKYLYVKAQDQFFSYLKGKQNLKQLRQKHIKILAIGLLN